MVDRLVNSEANSRRIYMVESCFGSSGQSLFVSGRVLVGEGVLTKMCRKKPKPRQFFLFNDILVYGNIVINKKKYNKQHIIPLEEVQLSSLEDDGQYRNGWLIKTPTKSFAVYAATATEKAEWMAHINKCVTDLLRKSGKKAAEMHAAVWVPDSDATTCQHCKKTQFTVINRRHHCRKCGRVVCGQCSNKRVLLPHQSEKPLRVCLTCYDEISSSRTGSSAIIPGTVNRFGVKSPDTVVLGEDSADRMLTQSFKMLHMDYDSFNRNNLKSQTSIDSPEINLSAQIAPIPPRRQKSINRNSVQFAENDEILEGKDSDASDDAVKEENINDNDNQKEEAPCDLFGAAQENDADAPPPTLWWDDIDLKNEEEATATDVPHFTVDSDSDSKEDLDNDSSADEDSNEEGDDSMQSPPSDQQETMTFYGEGNGNADDANTTKDDASVEDH